jgi:hypothetical protein
MCTGFTVSEPAQSVVTEEDKEMGAELFYAEGQTDMTKLVVAFRNPANARKKKLRNLRTSPKAV